MTDFYCVRPEVAGQAVVKGDESDSSAKLHYEFDGWLGDELLESVVQYIVTDELLNELRADDLTGYWVGEVEVSKSPKFEHRNSGKELPEFHWLRVRGTSRVDDFGIDERYFEEYDSYGDVLVVSEGALSVLRERQLAHADIELYESDE